MLTDWTSENGIRATEKISPITWRIGRRRNHLSIFLNGSKGREFRVFGADGWETCCLEYHVALSVIRDHAREWLEGHDIFVEIARDDGDIDKMRYQALRSGQAYTNRPITQWLDDYDACLIAAINAAGE